MIVNEGLPSDGSVSQGTDADNALEQTYRQRIVARQCLNMLVDIKTALSRQNKLLEIIIDQLNATRIRKSVK